MKHQGLSLIKSDDTANNSTENVKPKKQLLRNFLLWTNLMQTSTKYKDDGQTEVREDKWNVGLIAAIIVLYVTVIGGFIALAVGAAVFYLDMREDVRGNEAWQMKREYDARKIATEHCSQNAETLRALISHIQQTGQKVPPELLKIADCGTETKTK